MKKIHEFLIEINIKKEFIELNILIYNINRLQILF